MGRPHNQHNPWEWVSLILRIADEVVRLIEELSKLHW
jgi:hypothetical protein